jgi:hypothetical protein
LTKAIFRKGSIDACVTFRCYGAPLQHSRPCGESIHCL